MPPIQKWRLNGEGPGNFSRGEANHKHLWIFSIPFLNIGRSLPIGRVSKNPKNLFPRPKKNPQKNPTANPLRIAIPLPKGLEKGHPGCKNWPRRNMVGTLFGLVVFRLQPDAISVPTAVVTE